MQVTDEEPTKEQLRLLHATIKKVGYAQCHRLRDSILGEACHHCPWSHLAVTFAW